MNSVFNNFMGDTQEQSPIPVVDMTNTNPYGNNYIVPKNEKKPPREYSIKENIFAWVCYFLAYVFCLSIPISYNLFGAFVVIVLTFTVTFAVLLKGKKLKAMPMIVGLSAILISVCLITTSSDFLHTFAFIYSMIAYCYFLYGMTSKNSFKFKDSIIIDFAKAVFVLPFQSLFDIFKAMFTGKSNKSGHFVLKCLLGIAITTIPTVIIFSLLSYDSSFTKLLSEIFSFTDDSLFTHIVSLIFAVPVGAYIYGLFISSTDNKCNDVMTVESCKKSLSNMKIAPVVTILTAVLPILFMYVVFFVSQWDYYISGFTKVLPEDFSYAQYAREGFFQLCAVSVINLIIIILITLFIKRKDNKPSAVLRVLTIIYSLCTLILISTAVAKMVMYIDCYGLTPKRVYASWFMLVLAIVFILIIVKQFVIKLRLVAISLAVLILMFGMLALSGVDRYIAKYNIDRYVDKTLTTVDINAMNDLGDAAIPQLIRLSEIYDEKHGTDIASIKLDSIQDEMYYDLCVTLRDKTAKLKNEDLKSDTNIWEFNLDKYNAQQSLRSSKLYK